MIDWDLHIRRSYYDKIIKVEKGEIIQLNETDDINIFVTLSDDFFEFGEPYLLIGDVPHKLEFCSRITEGSKQYKTSDGRSDHDRRLFYNYFGRSEVTLCFHKNSYHNFAPIIVDVRARKSNADLAQGMMDFISNNLDDALMLCFSKTHIGSDVSEVNQDTLSKFKVLKDSVEYLISQQSLFIRDHKYKWEHELQLKAQGQPSGANSIHYLLNHLDKVIPCSHDNANIRVNNRSYTVEQVPCEVLVEDTDVYENQVIYSFLYAAKQYLNTLKQKNTKKIVKDDEQVKVTDNDQNYVSFDNVLNRYRKDIIKHHIYDIEIVSKQVDHLITTYNNKIKTKLKPQLKPRVTPFVAARPHYRKAFQLIHSWYLNNAPDLSNNAFLMGLRNLATIYEFVCLLMINKTLQIKLGFKLVESSYCIYGDEISYEGEKKKRPDDQPNNVFIFNKGTTTATLKYEPRIYQFREGVTKVGDFINVSYQKASDKYGLHYYCPDYILYFNDKSWEEDIAIVMDAKYMTPSNVLKYSIPDTEQKYLRDIFTIKENGSVGHSPIKLLMLMYAHGTEKIVSRLNARHHIGNEHSVFPQAFGTKVVPDIESEERLALNFQYLLQDYNVQVQTEFKLVSND